MPTSTATSRPLRRRRRYRYLGALLALVCFAALLAVWYALVVTRTGQLVEDAALHGSQIGVRFVDSQARVILSAVSMPAAVSLVVAVLAGTLWRGTRRRALYAALTVVAINASGQVLKHWVLWRPEFGLSQRMDGANTLPSGHTAMAASAAIALVLVVNAGWRAVAAWSGAMATAAMGYSTLVLQWHRPADVIGAILLATAWGGLAVAAGAWTDEERGDGGRGPGRTKGAGGPGGSVLRDGPGVHLPVHRRRVGVLAGLAWFGLVVGCAALILEIWTLRDVGDLSSRWELFSAYAAGAAGTVAAASLGVASVALLSPVRRR